MKTKVNNKVLSFIRSASTHALLIWIHIVLNRSEFYQAIKFGHKMELYLSKR